MKRLGRRTIAMAIVVLGISAITTVGPVFKGWLYDENCECWVWFPDNV